MDNYQEVFMFMTGVRGSSLLHQQWQTVVEVALQKRNTFNVSAQLPTPYLFLDVFKQIGA